MRELILLRHAHAEPAASGQDDHQRGLSATGRAEAQAAGEWLREHGLRPDRVLPRHAAGRDRGAQAAGRRQHRTRHRHPHALLVALIAEARRQGMHG